MNNVFYCNDISSVGGVETFLLQIAKKFKDTDLTILYKTADDKQIRKLREFARCIKFNGEKMKCKVLVTNYDTSIADYIEAEHYYSVVHADYIKGNWKPVIDKRFKYIGCSLSACKSFEELTGVKCECFPNPYEVVKPQKVLRLISAQRMTKEKGLDRCKKLSKMLEEKGIPYEWQIFCPDNIKPFSESVIIRKCKDNIINEIAQSDYLVLLSDSEGASYNIVEALSVGTPVIVTEHASFRWQGVKDGTNGYIFNYDLSNVNIDKIYNDIPKDFTYKQKTDKYRNILCMNKGTYLNERKSKYKVKSNSIMQDNDINDKEIGRPRTYGEEFIVDYDRLQELLGNNRLGLKLIGEDYEILDNGKKYL